MRRPSSHWCHRLAEIWGARIDALRQALAARPGQPVSFGVLIDAVWRIERLAKARQQGAVVARAEAFLAQPPANGGSTSS